MQLSIQNFGEIDIKYLVFDYNGTIAIDGKLIKNVAENLKKLSDKFEIYVITSDTYGSVVRNLKNLPIKIKILTSDKHTKEKEVFVNSLNASNVIAIGNGNNDSLMLKAAKIGVCIIQEEGASSKALVNSDIILKNIDDFFEMINKPKRLIATLRM